MEQKDINRRKFPRINYPCLVVVRNEKDQDDKDTILTHTENIGVGGVRVVLKQGIKTFSSVELELDLLDLEQHICCNGKVVWSVQRPDSAPNKPLFFDVGIEFVDITDEDKQRLKNVVDRLIQNHT